MIYQIIADDGAALDAHAEIDGNTLFFLSRGGTKGQDAINTEYGIALRLVLGRLQSAAIPVQGIWVDSSPVQALPLPTRQVLRQHESSIAASEQYRLIASRMKDVGRQPGAKGGGNSTRRLRIDLATSQPEDAVAQLLRLKPAKKDLRSLDRLPAEDLEKVTAEHVWNAIQKLKAGAIDHPFGPSTDFDLVTDDGTRLPPKAVFGIAASEALGFNVLPKHFSAGVGTPCFRILEQSGYAVVPKGAPTSAPNIPPSSEDGEWVEGDPRYVSHLRKERGKGLSKAKKDEFRRKHGKLECERCGLDPVAHFGSAVGEACIEVHHHAVQVQDMGSGHVTKLEDLQCLCANCHRVVHRELKEASKSADAA
jgi:5-methylcytosine-specific restriction protein A